MARAWVKTRFTDNDGAHEVGTQVDIPRTTPQEKANFDTLVNYGIIVTAKSQVDVAYVQDAANGPADVPSFAPDEPPLSPPQSG